MQRKYKSFKDTFVDNIKHAQYVSIDIFDTAILREVLYPKDIFSLVEVYAKEELSLPISFNFVKARILAEKSIRNEKWELSQIYEITLEDIYLKLRDFTGIPTNTLLAIKNIELKTEIDICTCNPCIHTLYLYLKKEGKKIIFTSDMYLPQECIEKILENSGYTEYERLFLSNQVGLTKASGTLFPFVLNEIDCEGKNILHIGDNYQSDILQANSCDIRTYFYQKCVSLAATNENHSTILQKHKKSTTLSSISLVESIHQGLVVNKLYAWRDDFCFIKDSSKKARSDFWYQFGYTKVGILLFGFVAWILKDVSKKKVRKIFFLSRDGYILDKAYTKITSYCSSSVPPSQYLYASRRALNVPVIENLTEENIDFLSSGTSCLSVRNFLERIGLKPNQYLNQIQSAGFRDANHLVKSGQDYERLRNLYRLLESAIVGVAQKERIQLDKYLNESGFLSSESLAIVDLGWHGSLQNALTNILNSDYKDKSRHTTGDLFGYYLGTHAKAKKYIDKGLNIQGYLCNCAFPLKHHIVITRCVEIFEFIFSAPHGSVINFIEREGVRKPVLDNGDIDQEKTSAFNSIHRGALDFIEQYAQYWKQIDSLSPTPSQAIDPLSQVLSRPSLEEATRLGNIKHAEGFGNVYVPRYIAKPPTKLEGMNWPISFWNSYRLTFWRIGYLKRIGKTGILVQHFLLLLSQLKILNSSFIVFMKSKVKEYLP